MAKITMANERGWVGDFRRNQAVGAIPNGSRVMKAKAENNDMTPIGALGTVLGSLDARELEPEIARAKGVDYCYWVEWDDAPKCAVFIMGFKIARPA